MGYPPLLLSDKISTSELTHLLTLQLLMPQSEYVFRLAFDKSSKAINYRLMKGHQSLGLSVQNLPKPLNFSVSWDLLLSRMQE